MMNNFIEDWGLGPIPLFYLEKSLKLFIFIII